MFTSTDALVTLIKKTVQESLNAKGYRVLQGTWLNAESEDANLSRIEVEGIELRWVRKLEHVTGLSLDNQVLCLHGPGVPVTIIGVTIGDITLADVGV